MPKSKLKPFKYVLFKNGKRVRTVTFYRPDQADADSCARAWIKGQPEETIKRVRRKS